MKTTCCVVEVFGVLIYHVSQVCYEFVWCPLSSIYLLSPLFHPGWTQWWHHPLSYGLIFFWILSHFDFFFFFLFWFLCIIISPNLFWVLFNNLFSLFSFLWLDQDYYVFNPNWKWKFSYCLKHLSSTISQIIDDLSHIQLKLFSIFIVIYAE